MANRQLTFALTSRAEQADELARYVAPLPLSTRAKRVLELLYLEGEKKTMGAHQVSELAISRSRAAKLVRLAKNTFAAGVEDLERAELLLVLRDQSPWVYFANWSRLAKLEPLETVSNASLGAHPFFQDRPPPGAGGGGDEGGSRSPPVSPGQGARDSVRTEIINLRVPVIPCSRDSMSDADRADQVGVDVGVRADQVGVDVAVRADQVGDALAERLQRPWHRQQGLTDADLIACVTRRQLAPLRRLYDEAVRLGWIQDGEDARVRFLTICHHAATSVGLNRSRMGNVVARVRRQLDVSKIRQASDRWAQQVLAASRSDPALAERLCDPAVLRE